MLLRGWEVNLFDNGNNLTLGLLFARPYYNNLHILTHLIFTTTQWAKCHYYHHYYIITIISILHLRKLKQEMLNRRVGGHYIFRKMEFNARNWLHRYWKAEGVRREHWGKARDNCKRLVPLLGVEQQRGREWNYKNPGAWRKSPANGGSDLRGMMKLFPGIPLEAEGWVTNRNIKKSKESPFSTAPDFHLSQCSLPAKGSRQRTLWTAVLKGPAPASEKNI